MKMQTRTFLLSILLITLMTASTCAAETSFTSNIDAINTAAQSVLMLDIYDSKDALIATGSGFVAFDNFTIITNAHVIQDADYIIGHSDVGNQYMINKVIAADENIDIAILEFFSPTDLLPLHLNEKMDIQRAEQIVTIGSPLGQKNSVSFGNISSLFEDNTISYIQFTAPISPGSSGGALFSDKGAVIGITTASFSKGQNINLAISISEVLNLYHRSHENKRTALSAYNRPNPTLNPTPTSTPSLKPTVKPTPTTGPLEDNLYFGISKAFDGSKLKNYKWYSYDKFDKSWLYACPKVLDSEFGIGFIVSGDNAMYSPPHISIMDLNENKKAPYALSLDILAGEKIYTFRNLRYNDSNRIHSVLYLGSIGKNMIEDMAKVKTVSVRVTFNDDSKKTYDLTSQDFASVNTWCKNIVKHKIFDCFEPYQLKVADEAHDAFVH